MKRIAIAVLAICGAAAWAQVHVNGYYRSNGTYVQPYQRTAPDSTLSNNYSTQGNINPYTGQAGTVNPYPTYQPPVYTPAPVFQPQPVCGYLNGQYVCR
jgi:hypothetical protein